MITQLPITELVLLLFFIITFGFSAYEKMEDFKGQVAWLTSYFKGTFMVKYIKLALIKILVLEIIATLLCITGIIELLATTTKNYALYGCLLCIVVLLALLTGQRIVKDYDGARNMVIYLLPAFFLLYLLTH